MIERWGNDRANCVDAGYICLVFRVYLYRSILSRSYTTTFEPVSIRHHACAVDEQISLHAGELSSAAQCHPLQAWSALDSDQLHLGGRNKRDRDTYICEPLCRNAGVTGVAVHDSPPAGQVALREKLESHDGRHH